MAGSPDHSPACARDTIESWDLDVLDLDTEGQAKVHQVRRAWEKGPKRLVRVWGVSPHFQGHTLLSPQPLGTLQELIDIVIVTSGFINSKCYSMLHSQLK